MTTMEEIKVTPAKAKAWLTESNTGNFRGIDVSRVERYSIDMKAGKWLYAADPIRFGDSGQLIDGQHRLSAIVKSGATIKMLVIRGIEDEAAIAIDKGKSRGTASWLRHIGVPNASAAAAIARLCLMHRREAWHQSSWGTNFCSDQEVVDFAEANRDSIQSAHGLSRRFGTLKGVPSTLIAAIMHEASTPNLSEKTEECVWFCEALYKGIGLEHDQAVYHLRERLGVKTSMHKESTFAVRVISTLAWNKTAECIPTKVLKLMPGNIPKRIVNVAHK